LDFLDEFGNILDPNEGFDIGKVVIGDTGVRVLRIHNRSQMAIPAVILDSIFVQRDLFKLE